MWTSAPSKNTAVWRQGNGVKVSRRNGHNTGWRQRVRWLSLSPLIFIYGRECVHLDRRWFNTFDDTTNAQLTVSVASWNCIRYKISSHPTTAAGSIKAAWGLRKLAVNLFCLVLAYLTVATSMCMGMGTSLMHLMTRLMLNRHNALNYCTA